MKNESKEDEYISHVSEAKFSAYVNREEKVVGIYSDPDDAYEAENNFALRKLRRTYKYKIQMVIK